MITFEGVGEAIRGSVTLTKFHPHLILTSLKVGFILTHLKLLDLICIFKQSFGEFLFSKPEEKIEPTRL